MSGTRPSPLPIGLWPSVRAALRASKFAPGKFVEPPTTGFGNSAFALNNGSREWIRTTDPHHVKVVL